MPKSPVTLPAIALAITLIWNANSVQRVGASTIDKNNTQPNLIGIISTLLLSNPSLDWEIADVKLSGISLASDFAQKRLFYSIGPGFCAATDHTAKVEYDTNNWCEVGFNDGAKLASGMDCDFGNITYASTATMQLYHYSRLIADYSLIYSNLPIISFKAQIIVDEPKLPGIFQIMSREYEQSTPYVDMGIEYRGSSAQWYPKKSYAIKFADNLKLLDLRKDDSWILDPAYRDISMVRNIISHDLWNDMRDGIAFIDADGNPRGQATIRGHLTEVIQDNQYQGMYILEERIDRKLLNLTKVDVPVDENGNDRWDLVDFSIPTNGSVLYKADSDEANMYNASGNVATDFDQDYPDLDDIAHWEPLEELLNFINNSSDAEFIAGIGNRVDIDNIVDFFLLTLVTSSTDTLKKNYYLYRNESEKFMMLPWDFDATFGLRWDGYPNDTTKWWIGTQNALIARLRQLTATGFNAKVKKRWAELRLNLFSFNSLYSKFVKYHEQLIPIEGDDNNAFNRNHERWPNSTLEPGVNFPELSELSYFHDWIIDRLAYLDYRISNLAQ